MISSRFAQRRGMRYSPPRGPVEIDWRNPLTNGLLLAYPGTSHLSVGGEALIAAGGLTDRQDTQGFGPANVFGSGTTLYLSRAVATGGPVTFAARCMPTLAGSSVN